MAPGLLQPGPACRLPLLRPQAPADSQEAPMRRIHRGSIVLLGLLLGSCSGDGTRQTITAEAQAAATFTAASCAFSPAGQITLTGQLTFGGLDARLIFRNN